MRPFRPSLDGPDWTVVGNGFFFFTKKWLVYFLALSLAMEKNGDLQKMAASNGQTSFLSDNKFWRKYEHLALFGVFFFKWPELQYVRFSEVTVRHKCHRDSTEEILLAWSSLCCWRAGGARLRVYTKQRLGVVKHQTWSWCVTRYQYCMSLYVFIYIDRTLYIIIHIYLCVTSNTHDTGIYNSTYILEFDRSIYCLTPVLWCMNIWQLRVCSLCFPAN